MSDIPLSWGDVGHSGSLTDFTGDTSPDSTTTLEDFRFTDGIVQRTTCASLTVRNCHFDHNGDQYGLNNEYNQSPNTTLLVEDSTFEGQNNASVIVGGSGSATFRRCQFRDAQQDFIKLFSGVDLTFEDCLFGGMSRTEIGSISYTSKTSDFTVGARLSGSSSGSSADIYKIEDNGDGTGTIWFQNPSNGTSATLYFNSVGETLTDNQGGSATSSSTGIYEDFHADGLQSQGHSGELNYTRCTFRAPPAQGGLQVQVTSGSWLESDAISSGLEVGDIYYKGSIGIFLSVGSTTTANITHCHFVQFPSNGLQEGSDFAGTFNLYKTRWYPAGVYNWRSGTSGTWNDLGGNVWFEAGTDLRGISRDQYESVFTGSVIDPLLDEVEGLTYSKPVVRSGGLVLANGLPLMGGT